MDRRYCRAVLVPLVLACAMIWGCHSGSGTTTAPLTTNVTGLANGTVDTPYYVAFTEAGGTAPYTWSQTSGGAMPAGITFTNQGILSGTPTASGSFGPYVFKVTDTNSLTASTPNLTLTINALTLSVTTSSLPSGAVGSDYSVTLVATGGSTPYTWSETSGGALPSGLTLSPSGVLSGMPTSPGTYGPYVFTVTDSNNKTAASGNLSITIAGTSASACTPAENPVALTSPYAFLVKGTDANGNPIDIAGSFTPNGSNGVSAAAVDYNGFSNGHEELQVNLANSSYQLSNSGEGCLSLNFSGLVLTAQANAATPRNQADLQTTDSKRARLARPEVSSSLVSSVQFSFVLDGALQSGRIIESDTASSGTYASGFLHAQTPSAFLLSLLATNFAFGADGWTASTAPGVLRTAIAGTFTNTSGAISAGYADINVGGTASGELTGGQGTLNGTIDPSTGRGTGSYFLTTPKGQLTLDFVFYVLNAQDVILLTTDTPQNDVSSPLLAGRALGSSPNYSTGALNGYYLLASQGLVISGTTVGNLAEIGTLNATSAPMVSAMIYSNSAGSYSGPQSQSASYVLSDIGPTGASLSGRVSFTGLTTSPLVVYLTGGGSDEGIVGFLVGTDAEASSGVLVFQTSASAPPAYNDASVSGYYAASTAGDIDGTLGAYLGAFSFTGSGAYSVVSQVSGSVPNSPNLGMVTINSDGSGNLDGGNYLLVTNGQVIFAIPDTGDPLLFVFTAGAP